MKKYHPLAYVAKNYGIDCEYRIETRETTDHYDHDITIYEDTLVFKDKPDESKLKKAFEGTNATLMTPEEFASISKSNDYLPKNSYLLIQSAKTNVWCLVDTWQVPRKSKDDFKPDLERCEFAYNIAPYSLENASKDTIKSKDSIKESNSTSSITMLFRTRENIDDNSGKITFPDIDSMVKFIESIGGIYSKEIADGFTQGKLMSIKLKQPI